MSQPYPQRQPAYPPQQGLPAAAVLPTRRNRATHSVMPAYPQQQGSRRNRATWPGVPDQYRARALPGTRRGLKLRLFSAWSTIPLTTWRGLALRGLFGVASDARFRCGRAAGAFQRRGNWGLEKTLRERFGVGFLAAPLYFPFGEMSMMLVPKLGVTRALGIIRRNQGAPSWC